MMAVASLGWTQRPREDSTPATIGGASILILLCTSFALETRSTGATPLNAMVLTRHRDMDTSLDHQRSARPRDLFVEELAGRLGSGRAFDYTSRRLTFYDNPDLSRLRGLALRAFTPRRTEALRPRVAAMTSQLC